MKASEVENLICQARDAKTRLGLFDQIASVRLEPISADDTDIFYHYPLDLVTEPAAIECLVAPHRAQSEKDLAEITAALAKLGIEVDERQALPDIIDEDYEDAA